MHILCKAKLSDNLIYHHTVTTEMSVAFRTLTGIKSTKKTFGEIKFLLISCSFCYRTRSTVENFKISIQIAIMNFDSSVIETQD